VCLHSFGSLFVMQVFVKYITRTEKRKKKGSSLLVGFLLSLKHKLFPSSCSLLTHNNNEDLTREGRQYLDARLGPAHITYL
jgi:hypothetical protein